MARSPRKPRKGPPSKIKHGKEKKQLRKRIRQEDEARDVEFDETFEDPREFLRGLQEAGFHVVEVVPAKDCARCGNQWPLHHSVCPHCKWDGKNLAFMLPMKFPEICS